MLISPWVYWLLVVLLGFETVMTLVSLGREKVETEKKSPRASAAISLAFELVVLYGLIA
jgi:hypothetical protein